MRMHELGQIQHKIFHEIEGEPIERNEPACAHAEKYSLDNQAKLQARRKGATI